MKLPACFVIAILCLAAQTQPPQAPAVPETKPEDLCTIEGQVSNNATGEPVRKAELSLRGTERIAGGMPPSYSAVSDAGGKFAIKDIEPGKYRLSIHRTGFVDAQYGARGAGRGGAVISLQKAQRIKDLGVKLIPHAVIAGRVSDEKNEALAFVEVSAKRFIYSRGKRQLADVASANTNDLGEYRLFGLAPGRYYVVALLNRREFDASQDRSAEPPPENYVPTYYPGAADTSAAVPLEVGPGVQLRGINLTLAKARTFRIRGHVNGREGVNVSLFPRGQSRWMSMAYDGVTDAKGNFEIENVQPGAYTLAATAWVDGNTLSARREIDMSDENVDNISLAVEPGAEIKGTVNVEGQGTPDLNSTIIALNEETGEFSAGDRVKDGAFTVGNLASSTYSVRVLRLPDGYWVKSVKMGEQEVRDSGFDLTHGTAGPLTVTIAPNAGQIGGTVLNEKQQPAPGATVVLAPEPKLRDREDAYQTTATDQYGSFSLRNVAPGEYQLFAWEEVEYGEYMDPDFLKAVEDRGQAISIHEGSRESVQLSAIPADSAAGGRSR